LYSDYVSDNSINIGSVCGNIAVYANSKNSWERFDWNTGGCGTLAPANYRVAKIEKFFFSIKRHFYTLTRILLVRGLFLTSRIWK
jgi:hypothetical protein